MPKRQFALCYRRNKHAFRWQHGCCGRRLKVGADQQGGILSPRVGRTAPSRIGLNLCEGLIREGLHPPRRLASRVDDDPLSRLRSCNAPLDGA